jgi:hypothetical protein
MDARYLPTGFSGVEIHLHQQGILYVPKFRLEREISLSATLVYIGFSKS